MRALHLFSNYKWTGPAEPALNLCVGLKALGVDVAFACGPDAGGRVNMVVESARARGIEPVLDFYLSKHRHPFKNFYDARVLSRLLSENAFDLVHCHMDNDHEIAIGPTHRHALPLFRSSYHGAGFPLGRRNRHLLRHTSFLIEPSTLALENDNRRFGVSEEKIAVVPGAVDTARFDPERVLPDLRGKLGIAPGAFVIGIVARMQTHRHYEDLFTAFHQLRQHAPGAHLMVVGRGTKQDRVGFEPVRRLGLEAHVTFTGFIGGDEYVGALKAMDAGVYLVPGSDGTCRTVREMMAMGVPVVLAQRGMLPEIAAHEREGLHFDNSADGLCAAFSRLHSNPVERAAFAANAKEKARASYSIEAQAKSVLEIYKFVL